MVEETPRFGLNTYEPGDTDWDHGDTVNAVDELAIARGSIKDRPETGSYDDELYLATDQRVLWRWDDDEADWIAAGGVGSADAPLDELVATLVSADSVATDELASNRLDSTTVPDGLTLNVDHDDQRESSTIDWETPSRWDYDSGEFQSLLETSYAVGGGYGVSGHWQIMSAHHYGPAYNVPFQRDVHCPIHIYGAEPDDGAAEFSITFGDLHNRRHRMWLSKAGVTMLEEPSPAAEFSILRHYANHDQVTHMAMTPNYLREGENITEEHTPISPGTFRFRGAYWNDGLETARMLQFTPSMDGDDHRFHVALEVESADGDLEETARIDQDGTWTYRDLAASACFRPPSVETVEELPVDANEPELVWVRDASAYFTYTETDGWLEIGNVTSTD